MDTNKKITTVGLVRVFFAIAVSAILVFIFLGGINSFMMTDHISFSKGWNVSFCGKHYTDVNLNRFRFPERVKKDEAIAITNRIPTSIGRNMLLSFRADYSHVRVYIDGRCVYSYMEEQDGSQRTPGSGVHVASLPENAAGSTCEIDLFVGLDDAFYALPDFNLIPSRQISSSYMSTDIYTCLAGFFMFMVGIILFCTSLVLFITKKNWLRSLLLGLFSFTMGTWALCRSNAVELFSSAFAINARIEHLCLYFSAIPFAAMMIVVRGTAIRKRQRICVSVGCISLAAFFVAAFILEYTQLVNVVHLYSVFHLVLIVSTSLVIYGTTKRKEERTREYRIQNAGIFIVIIGTTYEITRYYLKNVLAFNSRFLFRSQLPFIPICFPLIMLYAYLTYLNDHFMEIANEQALEKIAYTDVLTGLHNRAWCNREFERLAHKKGVTYSIISFDVNGLKRVNDSMGHAAGDSLIRDCAKILTSCFEDIGHVVRMGGDEFLVLFVGTRKRYILRNLKKMERLEASYGMRRDYQIKISYGISSSDEERGMTPEMVYQQADSRMYQMKKENRYSR